MSMFIKIVLWGVYLIFFYYTIFWFLGLLENKQKKLLDLKEFPEVSIAIPIYNEQNTIEGTVKSIFELDYPKDKLKVYCVNDGSTDNSTEILKKLEKNYPIIILNQENQGKFTALNNALNRTNSKYFACLDADSFVTKDSLKQLLREFTSENVAASMPIMKVFKPKNLILRIQHIEYMTSIFLKALMEGRDCIHVAPGPFTVYKTSILKKEGGFHKGHYTEDMEIALRLQSKNYVLKQSLDAIIYTKSPDTLKKYYKQRIRWYRGTFLNFLDYRKKLLFNKDYGDFGLIHMPLIGLGGVLTLLAVALLMVRNFQSLIHFFNKLYVFDFDILLIIKSMLFTFSFWSLDFFVVFAMVSLLVLSIFMLYLSIKLNKEKMHSWMYPSAFAYLFVYSILTAFIWLVALRQVVFSKDEDWTR